MNKSRIAVLALFLAALTFILADVPKSAHAWPGDRFMTVKIEGQTTLWMVPGRVDCRSATLTVPGRVIPGSVKNSWLPAKCTATFTGVPVNTWVTINLKVCLPGKCLLGGAPFTRTATRHTGNPPLIGTTKTLERIMVD